MLRYRLNRVFGETGIFFGISIASLGCYTIFSSWSGAILISIGIFWIFTVSSCKVDVKHFRISFPYELFGFIRIGDWIYVRRDMMLGVSEMYKHFRIKCSSNKIIDVGNSIFVIFLYDDKEKHRFVILKTKTKDKAINELARLSDLLGIHIKENNLTAPKKFLRINSDE